MLPGTGQLISGHTTWGSLVILAWIGLWLRLLTKDRVLAFVASPYTVPDAIPWGMGIALMLVWLLGNAFGVGRLAPPAD